MVTAATLPMFEDPSLRTRHLQARTVSIVGNFVSGCGIVPNVAEVNPMVRAEVDVVLTESATVMMVKAPMAAVGALAMDPPPPEWDGRGSTMRGTAG